MYASIPKNTYPTKNRSDDLECFHGGYVVSSADTDESIDLPRSVYLTNGNFDEKKFSIRVDLPSKYIEIPLSVEQLSKWFTKISVEDAVELQCERTLLNLEIPEQKEVLNLLMNQCNSRLEKIEIAEREAEREAERQAAIDMGEYDIGQEKGELNWLNDAHCEDEKREINACTLTPSTYYHDGECTPSEEKCEFCYKYWCGKCGNGLYNYLDKCCWK